MESPRPDRETRHVGCTVNERHGVPSEYQYSRSLVEKVDVYNTDALTNLEAQFANHQALWSVEGSSGRTEYEQAFLAQLELDPEWSGAEPVRRCFTWLNVRRDMKDSFNSWLIY